MRSGHNPAIWILTFVVNYVDPSCPQALFLVAVPLALPLGIHLFKQMIMFHSDYHPSEVRGELVTIERGGIFCSFVLRISYPVDAQESEAVTNSHSVWLFFKNYFLELLSLFGSCTYLSVIITFCFYRS